MISVEDRTAIREAVRKLLADKSAETDVRRAMETATGYDADLWHTLAEMGVAGLMIEEEFGGAGAGPLELELVMEEVGAALLCSPLLGSSVMAAELLRALGDNDTKRRILPGIAAGTTVASVAMTGETAPWTLEGVDVTATPADDRWRLQGTSSHVLHGQNAQVLLVLANGRDGLHAFEVDPTANGVTIEALPTFDHTLRMARIVFADAPARQIPAATPVADAVRQMLHLALVALAGDQVGGARRALELTVEYAKSRMQFGRAIGSFQAIKHMAADLLVDTEWSTSAARDAAQQLADGAPDLGAAICLAAFVCADTFSMVTSASVQMHGGIGYTWEYPAHLYLRRARADAQLFGASSFFRERYIQELGG